MNRIIGASLAFILISGCSSSSGPLQGVGASGLLKRRESKIVFVLTESNNISVPGRIDGKHPVSLMFHTGINGLSLTKDATARLADLKLDKSGTVTSWGGKSASRYGENHSLQIGDLSWERLTIAESDYSGPATDGKFGPHFFAGKVVAIDFDACTITLHEGLPTIDAGFQKMDLIVEDGLMFIEGAIRIDGRQYEHRFMIHSGFGGTLLLDDDFVSKNRLDEQLPTTSVAELKDSFGNIVKTRNVLLPSMNLGNSRLEEVPVGLFDAALGRQKVSVLGGNLLKRFNIILDSKEGHIYLKPNKHFGDPFSKNG